MSNLIQQIGNRNKASINLGKNERLLKILLGSTLVLALTLYLIHRFLGIDLRSYLPPFD